MQQLELQAFKYLSQLEGVRLKQLSETFVLEIEGLDLVHRLDEKLIFSLQDLLAHYLVSVIRGQNLNDQTQQSLTESLGTPRDQSLHAWAPPAEDHLTYGRLGKLGNYRF